MNIQALIDAFLRFLGVHNGRSSANESSWGEPHSAITPVGVREKYGQAVTSSRQAAINNKVLCLELRDRVDPRREVCVSVQYIWRKTLLKERGTGNRK